MPARTLTVREGGGAYTALDERAAAKAAAVAAAGGGDGGGKFSGTFMLSCGGIEAFYKGLAGRLGTPPS